MTKSLFNEIKTFIKNNKSLIRSFIYVIVVALISVTVIQLRGLYQLSFLTILVPIVIVVLIITIGWFLHILLGLVFNRARTLKRFSNSHSQTTVEALKNLINLVIYTLLCLVALKIFGVEIGSFLAIGGIAGLAVGLAAKDLLANLFGGLFLFMDRQFSVGDWVTSSDRDIEGTVKRIGLRITEIETFDSRPLYIPNSVFTNIIIENPGRMKNRRILQVFSLKFCDASKVEKIVSDIENYLRENNAIASQFTLMVNLIKLTNDALDCEVYCFTKTTDWKTYRGVRQIVLLEIINIIHRNDAELAIPIQMIEIAPKDAQEYTQEQIQEHLNKTTPTSSTIR